MLLCLQVHVDEPSGDILVFLTGQDEIDSLERLLHERVSTLPDGLTDLQLIITPMYAALPPEQQMKVGICTPMPFLLVRTMWIAVGCVLQRCCTNFCSCLLPLVCVCSLLGFAQTLLDGKAVCHKTCNPASSWVLKLGGNVLHTCHMLCCEQGCSLLVLLQVFDPAPAGARKAILATNIAETSITIPGVKYVIDTGFVKARGYNAKLGADSLQVVPVSQAQARQRSGRAGVCHEQVRLLTPHVVYEYCIFLSLQTETGFRKKLLRRNRT